MKNRDDHVDVLLVCTPGGHLQELFALRDAWSHFSRAWVTFDASDARSLLRDERVFFAYPQRPRHLPQLVRNLVLAWRLLRKLRPKVILTTGAQVAVPFAWVGRLLNARVAYVESAARIDSPSLSAKLIAPVADRVYVQWRDLLGALPRARYAGNLFLPDE